MNPENRILIFIVAYNAETTLRKTIERIPQELHRPNVQVLVIDDCSPDSTFFEGQKCVGSIDGLEVVILRNPENLGYGGNQKLGYRYALDNGFDVVAMVHGDGQYAPEKLPDLLEPLLCNEADVVFGSRMLIKRNALQGGMPLYKWFANQFLTTVQNKILGTSLSEFHTGYRLYTAEILKSIPFERNADDFHFDTDIIIQLVFIRARIKEIAIPTFYGDEVCYVNGFKYAWDILCSTVRGRLHLLNLFYDRRFDLGQPEFNYDLKADFVSSHSMAINAVKSGMKVLDVACGQGLVAEQILGKASKVVGIDQYEISDFPKGVEFSKWDLNSASFPVNPGEFDQILLLDIIEHLNDPETFLEKLREACSGNRPEIILTTGNVAFIFVRLSHLLGNFNYGRKGILDRTHTRLFTFKSMAELLRQAGYSILEERGIPAPYPKAIGDNTLSRILLFINQILIKLLPGLFAYQIYMRARVKPTVRQLLQETLAASTKIKQE